MAITQLPAGRLEIIPGVGPSIGRDLKDLGFGRVEDLAGADPEQMYAALCELRGTRIDRCVLYVFRCAAYFASTPDPEPARLKWWHWKDTENARGKRLMAGTRQSASIR